MFFGLSGSGSSRSVRRLPLLPLSLLLLASPSLAQINTIAAWDGINYISSFGVANTATYGQTITVAANSTPLNSFSFEIGYCSANVTMRGAVYAWDGAKATGSALYESAPVTIVNSNSYQLVTFSPGGLTLPAGSYVLFATTSRDQTGAPGSGCSWGALPNNTAIPNGNFVFQNNAADTTQWTSSNWAVISKDLAMRVDGLKPPTAAVPAASTTSLLIGFASLICIGLLGLSRSRRHESTSTPS
jgi:hypothetical protein